MEIVESNDEWNGFKKIFNKESSILLPVQCDESKHPMDSKLCILYVIFLTDDLEEYILPFRHSDAVNLNIEYIKELNTEQTVYTYDKKKLLHFVELENVCDMQMKSYLETNQPLIIEDSITPTHEYFYRTHYKKSNLNCVIPILKHLEASRIIVDRIKGYSLGEVPESYDTYNNKVLTNLQRIESNGLQTTDGMVYSEYNPYTATGRPSNRFGGMNFAALNKKDGSRKKFISRHGKDGMLVEMDYDAYHLRLIGDAIDYKFPKGSVHQHMAEFYGVDYNESKGLSFQYLYGHIPDEVLDTNPFFKRVQMYINDVWNSYKSQNFILSDIYNKRIYRKNLSDMNKNKVFNYLIQLMETENNMRILTELLPEINDYKSKLVLYSYDSFLFDFYLPDGLNFLQKVKGIIEQNDKFPVKVGKGWNYHEMEDITEKFE